MVDSTGRAIYKPDCADVTTLAINKFVFEATIDILKVISGFKATVGSNQLTLTNIEQGNTYEVSLTVRKVLS